MSAGDSTFCETCGGVAGWYCTDLTHERITPARMTPEAFASMRRCAKAAAAPSIDLYAAFVAGFTMSAEGWNGEYPFDDKGQDVAVDRRIRAAFEAWLGGPDA